MAEWSRQADKSLWQAITSMKGDLMYEPMNVSSGPNQLTSPTHALISVS